VFKQKGTNSESFFNSCNKDRQGKATMQSVETAITNILPSVQIKQIEAIKAYIDPKKTGSVSKDAFIQAIERATKEMRREGTEQNDFQEEELGSGDQSMVTVPQTRSTVPINVSI
jgi:hypothetical protein